MIKLKYKHKKIYLKWERNQRKTKKTIKLLVQKTNANRDHSLDRNQRKKEEKNKSHPHCLHLQGNLLKNIKTSKDKDHNTRPTQIRKPINSKETNTQNIYVTQK